MNTVDDLQSATTLLADSMKQDLLLSLALAATWLDPLAFDGPNREYGDIETDDQALARFVLDVARECLPQTYASAIQHLRYKGTLDQIERTFITGLKRKCHFIPLDCIDISELAYGIPMHACGLNPQAADFRHDYPGLAGILTCHFGIQPTPMPTSRDGWPKPEFLEKDLDTARHVVRPIISSLVEQDRQPYADLALTLMYLFNMTGNTLLDVTDEDYWDGGYDVPTWSLDNLNYVEIMYREAYLVLAATKHVLSVLETDADIANALTTNIQIVRTALERKRKHVSITWPPRRAWPRRTTESHRDTGAGARLHFIRDCYP